MHPVHPIVEVNEWLWAPFISDRKGLLPAGATLGFLNPRYHLCSDSLKHFDGNHS